MPEKSIRLPARKTGASTIAREVCGMEPVSCAKIVANASGRAGVFSSARLAILLTDYVTVYKMAGFQLNCNMSDEPAWDRLSVDVSARFKGN